MATSLSEITYRIATADDVPAMVRGRLEDPSAGPPDHRMAAYLRGFHHPQHALAPRVAFIGLHAGRVVGYIAGHLSERFGCDGELQYLYVASDWRRRGVATALVEHLARWFAIEGAYNICVNVDADSEGAAPFYTRHGAQPLEPHWLVWPDIRVLADRSSAT